MSGITHLLSDARGIYIPRDFVTNFMFECQAQTQEENKGQCSGWKYVTPEMIEICSNPDNEFYWDVWSDILDYAEYEDESGNVWHLYQDGDLWAVCYELLTDEERENFGFSE